MGPGGALGPKPRGPNGPWAQTGPMGPGPNGPWAVACCAHLMFARVVEGSPWSPGVLLRRRRMSGWREGVAKSGRWENTILSSFGNAGAEKTFVVLIEQPFPKISK